MNKFNLPRLQEMVAGYARLDPNEVDARIIVGSLRMILEEVVNSFVECFERPFLRDSMNSKIMLLRAKGYFPEDLARKAQYVYRIANISVHGRSDDISADEAKEAIRNIQDIVAYYEQY